MLYGKGTVSLNGGQVPGSSAIYPGDAIHTETDGTANINFTGSSAVMLSNSATKLEDNAFSLDKGTIAVITSVRTSTHVCQIRVTPVSDLHTEYEVRYNGTRVEIIARKGDVTVQAFGKTVTVPEAQEAHREDPCKAIATHHGAFAAASGPSPYLIGTGASAVAGLITWVLIQGDDPLSPSKPSK
jgi:hypothetical protein